VDGCHSRWFPSLAPRPQHPGNLRPRRGSALVRNICLKGESSSSAGSSDRAAKKQNLRPADGGRRELQQREAAKVGYFRELLKSNPDIDESLRPLLQLCRETLVRLQKTESALIRSLARDRFLVERVEHLMTIPAVGPITALTWALEVGEVSRFSCIKKAISYCGLCGAEQSSGEHEAPADERAGNR